MHRFIGYLLFFLLPISCIKEDGSNVDLINSGSPAKVNCTLNVSTLDVLTTKTTEAIEESSVADLWVLQFNGQADASVLRKATYYTAPDITNLNLNLLTGTGQSVYFIANTGDNTMFNSTNAPLNSYAISALKAKTVTYTSESNNFVNISGKNYLRMTGTYLGDISTTGTTFAITISRLCAKIAFTYTSIASTNAGEVGAIVKITSVALKSVPSGSKLLSNPANTTVALPASTIDYPATTSGVGLTSGTVNFYMPENLRGLVATNTTPLQKAGTAPAKATYLEVNGDYYPSGATSPTKYVTYKLFLGENAITNYNIKSNKKYTVNITFKGLNISDTRIITTSTSTANCYIVVPGESISIRIGVKGNGESTSAALSSLSTTHTAASVGVVWQTVSGLVTCTNFNSTNQTVTVNAPLGSTSGNAVIAAYSGAGQTGTILWSWHIWVTSYNPNTGTTYSYTPTTGVTNVFMDRNLGALTTTNIADANILHYQWGRKDPFPAASVVNASGTSTSVDVATTTTQTMLFSSQNPFKFIRNATSPNDWCSKSSSYYWMGTGGTTTTPGVKTIFDPCPVGWRVPAWRSGVSPWNGLSTTGATWGSGTASGYTWLSVWFWPAAGIRHRDTGALDNVEVNGDYWSASPGSGHGYCLVFSSGAVFLANGGDRAFGMSVRCVKE